MFIDQPNYLVPHRRSARCGGHLNALHKPDLAYLLLLLGSESWGRSSKESLSSSSVVTGATPVKFAFV
jgi:hypothetical protein